MFTIGIVVASLYDSKRHNYAFCCSLNIGLSVHFARGKQLQSLMGLRCITPTILFLKKTLH